ncbi:MAG: HAD family hydrolase [Thermodesulfobacteriota bacterium]
MSPIKIVAFDCDGVLFDTVEANRAYYNCILARMDLPALTDEQFLYVQMHTVEEALIYLCGAENLAQAHAHRRQVSYLPFISHMKKAPFLEDLLDRLSGRMHTAIATNRSNTMNRVLEEHGLADRFELVVTALDVMRPKPAPEQLLKILDFFNARPDEMMYVGDSSLDEMAARSAQVPFIAFNNTALSADYHVTGMREVGAILGLE